jgi:hypothetical protein
LGLSYSLDIDAEFMCQHKYLLEGGLMSGTLTKASITEMVAAENGWSQRQSSEYVELSLEIRKPTLASGEDILISGFGKF